jgi:hypothetical protein
MGSHQIKKLLHSKKITQRMGEIFAGYLSDKGLISRIHKELKFQKNNPVEEWANELNR